MHINIRTQKNRYLLSTSFCHRQFRGGRGNLDVVGEPATEGNDSNVSQGTWESDRHD